MTNSINSNLISNTFNQVNQINQNNNQINRKISLPRATVQWQSTHIVSRSPMIRFPTTTHCRVFSSSGMKNLRCNILNNNNNMIISYNFKKYILGKFI